MSGNAASRYAVLESGVVDASLLSVPENIIAHEKGYNELLFLGDVVEFPQNGFGTSEKHIRENPDEVYRDGNFTPFLSYATGDLKLGKVVAPKEIKSFGHSYIQADT